MPNLLHLSLPRTDNTAMLYPWEQRPDERAALDDHAARCPSCTAQTFPIFGATMTRTVFDPRCADGAALAQTMLARV